jgi:hypothetical protein
MKPRIWLVLLLLVCTAFVVHAAETAPPQPPSSPASAAQIARAQASKEFQKVLKLAEERGEEVNLKTVRAVTRANQPGVVELRFDLTTKGSTDPGVFKQVVYVEGPGRPAVAYFGGLHFDLPQVCLGGGGWGSWTKTSDCMELGSCPLNPWPAHHDGDLVTTSFRTCQGFPRQKQIGELSIRECACRLW